MTDLPYLASRLYGTPLLIARPKLEVILSVVGRKLAGDAVLSAPQDALARDAALQITAAGIAIIPILGTLVRRSSYLAAASGLTSYHDIERQAESAFADRQVNAVLLEIDSSGGEAGGVFDLAQRLRSLSKASGKPLWAIADEAALSAAYALACAADRLWLTRTAEVGSIGVVAVHTDVSAADAKAGLSYRFIHAGAHKVDGHPHAPLPESVATDIQTDINALHDQFIALVAGLRRIDPAVVRATEARVYRGESALAAGLADQIGCLREAIDALSRFISPAVRSVAPGHTRVFSATKTSQEILMSTTQTPATGDEPAELTGMASTPTPATQMPPMTPQVDEAAITAQVESRLRAQLAELTEVAAQAKRLGVSIDPMQALAQRITPDALRQTVLKAAAERDAAQDLVALAPAQTGNGSTALADSPLVKAARQANPNSNTHSNSL